MSADDALGHLLAIASGMVLMLLGPWLGARRQPEDRFALWASRALTALGALAVGGNLLVMIVVGLSA